MELGQARRPLLAIGVLIWAGALYGATQLYKLDLPLGHGVCGPWGCAAEPEALLGYHTLWLTLLAPTLGMSCRVVGGSMGRRLADCAIAVGVVGVLGLAIVASVAWLRDGNGAQYAIQRGLFVVVTTPDLPALPLALSGLAGRLVSRGAPGADA